MTQDWDEVEALRESLREHMAEIKRLNECLTWEQHRAEHVGTHGPRCAMWGPKHYECLLRAYNAMKERTSQESRQVEPIGYANKKGLFRCTGDADEAFKATAIPLYTAPPRREPLTEREVAQIESDTHFHEAPDWAIRFARAIERAHGIGGEE